MKYVNILNLNFRIPTLENMSNYVDDLSFY